IENGALVNEDPQVIPLEALNENTNFSRITEVPLQGDDPERYLVSGPAFGPFLIDDETIFTEGVDADFFPGWAMYAHIFYYQDVRYMAYMHVKGNPEDEQNTLYILDLSDGATVDEAFVNLSEATFQDKVVHSVDIGTIPNLNASVSVDIAHDIHGNLMIMGFAAGNGFVVEKIGDETSDFYTLPFTENFDGTGESTPEDWIPEDWMNVDADGDTEVWLWDSFEDTENDIYETYMTSYSYTDETGALTPDNWLITPQIYLEPSAADEYVNLLFHITTMADTPEYRLETYQVLISETDTDPESFSVLWEETFSEEDENRVWKQRNIDLSDYEGKAVYLAFRHYDSTDLYGIAIEKVEISTVSDSPEPDVADLTLNVQMLVWEELGLFDPENDFVDVAGDFNNWGEDELVLSSLEDEELTYTITIPDLYVDSVYEFKFRINGSWDDETAEFPEGGPNRSVTITDGENEYTYWYNDDQPSSVADLDQLSLSVFPNPATRYFTLTAESKIKQLIVRDLTGREVLKKHVDDFEVLVSTQSLQNGIYLVDIYSEHGISVEKIQVVK
ncbi:MAG: choice-of-anchor J domain-containing protein, partial [Bacteroidota bacterium]